MPAEILRPAAPADREAVERLVEAAYGGYIERIGRRPAPMDADYVVLIAAGRVTVAERDGEVAGVLVLVPMEDHLLVENIAVDPTAQHTGLGRRLMAHAEDEARALGLSELRLYTNERMVENIAWYPRLGYRETERRAESGFARVFFRKRLS
ncbi:MAG TPA: GNAT family N-acetyltransferase [Gaiellales bacterium]|nr:GNAT family N-acetyltransferase [Gaiellales bacterium]